MRCEHCGGELATTARRHARTCSSRCRVALHRARRREAEQPYPVELRERDRWVRWAPTVRRGGRPSVKLPLRADGRGAASSTDRRTWSGYGTASRSAVGVGLGFVLDGDGIVCVDLDHCVVDGQVAEWAQELLDWCPPTYVEVSPSGTGLHIWGRGRVGAGRVIRRGDVAVEVYGQGRYIAMGEPCAGAPRELADISALVDELV